MATRRKRKPYHLTISNHIDVNYRNYALYVLEQRGIPSYYDGLTNVQRLILHSSPTTFNKTMVLVGSCFKNGYHHGDASLVGGINKLTRNFNCAAPLLTGDGFFGTPLNPAPAAARYTSVKIDAEANKIIKENHFLDTKNDEDFWNPLWLEQPLGLDTMIIGIAVGYKTTVLPRNRLHVKQYFEGNRKSVKPYFNGFTGKISKFNNIDRSWMFEGVLKVNEPNKSIHITELPPLMKYESFIKKLDKIIDRLDSRVEVENNSSIHIDVVLKFKGDKYEWKFFRDAIVKGTKMIVTESPIFIKDGLVLEYDRIEDYLDDFKYRKFQLVLERTKYFLNQVDDRITFNESKKKYLEYMLSGKKTLKEIDKFLNKFPKDIARKLDGVLLKQLNTNELDKTIQIIKESKTEKIKLTKEVKKLQKEFGKMVDNSVTRGTAGVVSTIDLFSDEMMEYDGVEVFDGKDEESELDEKEEEMTENK